MVYKTWTNEPGKVVQTCNRSSSGRRMASLTLSQNIFVHFLQCICAACIWAGGSNGTGAYAHMRPEVHVCCSLLYFSLKKKKTGPVSHRIWGLPSARLHAHQAPETCLPHCCHHSSCCAGVYHHATQLFMWMPRIWTQGRPHASVASTLPTDLCSWPINQC